MGVRASFRQPLTGPLTVLVTAKAPDGRSAPLTTRVDCLTGAACEAAIDLPERGWVLEASAPGWWVAGPTWSADQTMAGFELWPAATVTGQAVFPERSSGSDVTLRLRAAGGRQREGGPEKAEVPCPIVDGHFACNVPAGVWDVAARVRGHVSVFFWDRPLPTGAPADLGTLTFLPGASVIGTVVSSEKEAPKAGECRVTLHPSGETRGARRQAAISPLSAAVNEKGFFSIARVPPGRYQLVASQVGFAPASQEVLVLEGAEASVKRPLELGRPRRVEVYLAPPQDPWGKPWRVALLEKVEGRGIDIRGDSPASLGGVWSFEGASTTGRYQVRVQTSDAHNWYTDDEVFSAKDSPTKRMVTVGMESVRGSLHLGKKPLQGTVVFGKEFGSVSVPLRSDETGSIEGFLPRIGKWNASVSAENPPVKRTLDVEVRRASAAHGVFEIRLPDAALHGEVLLEDGQPATRATVTVRSRSGAESNQQRVDTGAFRFEGLSAGTYTVSAEGAGTYSDEATVTLRDDETGTPEPVRLVLKKKDWLRLRLVGPSGGGVVGFPVWFLPSSDGSTEGYYSKPTDAEGRVTVSVRGGQSQKCVAVFGGGYATKVIALPVGDEQLVQLGSVGGTILAGEGSPPAVLIHGGCRLPVPFLVRNAGSDGRTLSNLEPGPWALCLWGPGDRGGGTSPCRSGQLDPFGTLDLSGFAAKE